MRDQHLHRSRPRQLDLLMIVLIAAVMPQPAAAAPLGNTVNRWLFNRRLKQGPLPLGLKQELSATVGKLARQPGMKLHAPLRGTDWLKVKNPAGNEALTVTNWQRAAIPLQVMATDQDGKKVVLERQTIATRQVGIINRMDAQNTWSEFSIGAKGEAVECRTDRLNDTKTFFHWSPGSKEGKAISSDAFYDHKLAQHIVRPGEVDMRYKRPTTEWKHIPGFVPGAMGEP